MNELEIKTERLVQMLKAENLGGVLLNSQLNFAWLTAGANNSVDLSRENGVSSLLIRNDGKRFLIANKIEMPRMLAEETFLVTENGIEVIAESPDFPKISNVIEGIEYLTPDILEI